MERKFASVKRIIDVSPISGADRIEVVTILGWKVVVKKGQFKVGDLCVYFEIDSMIPYTSWSSFLFDGEESSGSIRIKTHKMKGQISQGLAIPLSEINIEGISLNEGVDLSDVLAIKKYDPPETGFGTNTVKNTFPVFIPKTDETRVQSVPEIIEEIKDKEIYISQKIDGTSITIYYNGSYNVCSRNNIMGEDSRYWTVAKEFGLDKKLPEYCNNKGMQLALQGELYGEGVQKNRLKINGNAIAIFNIYDIVSMKYLDFNTMCEVCNELQIPVVSILYKGVFKWNSVEELVDLAKGKYSSGYNQEGIVIRPVVETYSSILKGRLSFKVINNDYLLKE
jgi:RNA ligase (TIGR02306 family)